MSSAVFVWLVTSAVLVLGMPSVNARMGVIEAMLTGLPVVATGIRGPREQVVAGETGLLVPPETIASLAEALSRLATDPALQKRMGQAGQARALDSLGV